MGTQGICKLEKLMTRKIGAHVSASGGLEKAIQRAYEIGANCAQIFSGSPRIWRRKELGTFDTTKMFSEREKLFVGPIFTHSPYLVNLASDNPDILRKSFDALRYDLQFDSLIKGSGIIVHLGSHTGRGWDSVKNQVAEQILKLLESTPENSTFLVENSAGQNGKLCSDFNHIRWLIDEINTKSQGKYKKRVGWCFDTCHAYASGYALGESIESLISRSATQEITNLGLFSELKCIHVNDSKDSFHSGRDRHDNLGKGNIPASDLAYFLNFPEVRKIPLILEVPGFDGNGPDEKNIQILKNICK